MTESSEKTYTIADLRGLWKDTGPTTEEWLAPNVRGEWVHPLHRGAGICTSHKLPEVNRG